jgi:hypothetical protein
MRTYSCMLGSSSPPRAARWQSGDHSMLQPVAVFPWMAVGMTQIEVKKAGWF